MSGLVFWWLKNGISGHLLNAFSNQYLCIYYFVVVKCVPFPTLMQFQGRRACCSYPESLPLENNSKNCSMYAMITSVLSNRNHPSLITLLGKEIFNLPGIWLKVQTIRKARLQRNLCHYLAQCFTIRIYRYARRPQLSWSSYAKLPSTCSESQQNFLSTAVVHWQDSLSKLLDLPWHQWNIWNPWAS